MRSMIFACKSLLSFSIWTGIKKSPRLARLEALPVKLVALCFLVYIGVSHSKGINLERNQLMGLQLNVTGETDRLFYMCFKR